MQTPCSSLYASPAAMSRFINEVCSCSWCRNPARKDQIEALQVTTTHSGMVMMTMMA